MSLDIKHLIAVASAKGGVGKSTTAVNLALALQAEGHRVGILDADIYGPSIPTMLNLRAQAETEGQFLVPLKSHGLQAMSIGFLVDDADSPMIWRGPMATKALQQLLFQTKWDKLDYLIIDLPPGTGDIQLTMAQKFPLLGAVLVTTPQELAVADVRKGLHMFNKVNVPVLGVIENMSLHTCSECGHAESIFGAGGAKAFAEQHNVDFLGALPLDKQICEQTDSGSPTVAADPEGVNSLHYRTIAKTLKEKISLHKPKYSHKFPKITVTNKPE